MAQEGILEHDMRGATIGPVDIQDRIRGLHRPHGAKNRPIRKAVLKVAQGMRENVENFVIAHDANLHVILDIFLHTLLPSVVSVSSEYPAIRGNPSFRV